MYGSDQQPSPHSDKREAAPNLRPTVRGSQNAGSDTVREDYHPNPHSGTRDDEERGEDQQLHSYWMGGVNERREESTEEQKYLWIGNVDHEG